MKTTEPQIVNLALGRIFGTMMRPFRPGDIQEYERCRKIVLDHTETAQVYEVNYVRDRMKGAQGQ